VNKIIVLLLRLARYITTYTLISYKLIEDKDKRIIEKNIVINNLIE